jgi:hypothetical protein
MDTSLENKRHTLAHLLAAAVLVHYPKAKPTIGPAIENGFYYDFEFSKAKGFDRDLIFESLPARRDKPSSFLSMSPTAGRTPPRPRSCRS